MRRPTPPPFRPCSLLFGPTAKWLVAVLGYLSCFASINIYLQGFARLIWSMAREGKLPVSLARLTARGAAAGLESGARYLSGLHHPDHLVATAPR